MPISRYPFHKLEDDQLFKPYLPIILKNPKTGIRINTFGLIDTGADSFAAPAGFAEALGYNLKEGDHSSIHTGNGEASGYVHSSNIQILNYKLFLKKKIKTVINIPQANIDYIPGLNFFLIGVSDFLDNYKLSVDYPRKIFSVKKDFSCKLLKKLNIKTG